MMISGLRRATLEAIETRSWKVGRRHVLTGEEVVNLYLAIPDNQKMRDAVRGPTGIDAELRRYDRALKVLKTAGLVRYKRGAGWRWTHADT